MRFYPLSDEQVLKMPARRFFALNRQIPKLRAEEALMQINVIGAAVGGGEGAQKFIQALQEQVGVEKPARPKVDLASIGLGGD
jgi:hypothetical protein